MNKRTKERTNERTNERMNKRTNEWTDGRRKTTRQKKWKKEIWRHKFLLLVAEMSFFIIGGTNVEILQVAQKSGFKYRWHKCCIGTKVVMALTSVAKTSVALTSVAKTSVVKKSRHWQISRLIGLSTVRLQFNKTAIFSVIILNGNNDIRLCKFI